MWLLARAPDSLDEEERAYRDALCRLSPDAAQAEALVQAFQAMVRRRSAKARESPMTGNHTMRIIMALMCNSGMCRPTISTHVQEAQAQPN
jgi:hypothetical protein